MTAEPSRNVLLYARGGGCGHAMRGAALQRILVSRGHRVRLLVTRASAAHVQPMQHELATLDYRPLADLRHEHDTLIVDTFPRGWSREIDDAVLARFSHRVLLARYNSDPAFPEGATRYDRLLLPYPALHDEWCVTFPRAAHTGWLVRDAPMHIVPEGDTVVVFDPGQRVPPSLLEKLERFLRSRDLRLVRLVRTVEKIAARKFLCVGAGYNTVYELAHSAADLRFLPLARRWDDQARRVTRLSRNAGTLSDLLAWITAPLSATPMVPQQSLPTSWSLA